MTLVNHSTVEPREILPFAGAASIGLAAAAIALVGFLAAHRRRGRPLAEIRSSVTA